jgi:DNA-directed RNA polymerase subunit beta
VLLKEMQSLALDVNVVSEEGQRAEIRDEDDDLLRAAEELGIDLSGVRALSGDAADEAVEGEDATDAEPSANGSNGSDPAAVADVVADGDEDGAVDLEGLEEIAEDAPEVAET